MALAKLLTGQIVWKPVPSQRLPTALSAMLQCRQ